jgi:hypothetical protein
MEELCEIIKNLDLEIPIQGNVEYEYINVFKNPNKLPINQIHLEKKTIELYKGAYLEWSRSSDEQEARHFDRKVQVLPALVSSFG